MSQKPEQKVLLVFLGEYLWEKDAARLDARELLLLLQIFSCEAMKRPGQCCLGLTPRLDLSPLGPVFFWNYFI